MLENALDCISPQLDDKLNATTNATNKPSDDQENVDPNVQLTAEFLSAAKLKKKRGSIKRFEKKKNLAWQVTQGEAQAN